MTLTQTAIVARRTISLSIITLVVSVVFFIGYSVWSAYEIANRPPVEEKPNQQFGNLPSPDFPKTSISSSNYSYTLDTSTGSLPKLGVDSGFEKIIKVYFIAKPHASLLSFERSQQLAGKFDITTPPQILSETNYRYTQDNKTLNVDLDSGNFSFVRTESTSDAQEGLDDDTKLLLDFKNFLSQLDIFNEQLNGGRTQVTLLKKQDNQLTPTSLRSEAQAAQISLWQKDRDKKSILTPDFNNALINTKVSKSASQLENYLELNFTYWQIDETTFATYYLKSPETAFEDLKAGKGAVILEPAKPQVSITSIYIAYFLSQNYTPYLQPIYVFEGPQFVSYVPAIAE